MKATIISILILFGLISGTTKNEKSTCKCVGLIEELDQEYSEEPLQAAVVRDSTRLGLPLQKGVEFFRLNSSEQRFGKAGILFDDGFFIKGEYNNEGQRDGIWFLFDCRKRLKIYEQYHYENGYLNGVVTQRKIKDEKLKSIPLHW